MFVCLICEEVALAARCPRPLLLWDLGHPVRQLTIQHIAAPGCEYHPAPCSLLSAPLLQFAFPHLDKTAKFSNVKHILVHSKRSSCRIPPLHSHHCIIYTSEMSAKRQRTDKDATSTGNVTGNNDRATKKPRLVEGWNSVTQYFTSILLPVVKLVVSWSHTIGEFLFSSLSVSFD